jgi:hypothetical protein
MRWSWRRTTSPSRASRSRARPETPFANHTSDWSDCKLAQFIWHEHETHLICSLAHADFVVFNYLIYSVKDFFSVTEYYFSLGLWHRQKLQTSAFAWRQHLCFAPVSFVSKFRRTAVRMRMEGASRFELLRRCHPPNNCYYIDNALYFW